MTSKGKGKGKGNSNSHGKATALVGYTSAMVWREGAAYECGGCRSGALCRQRSRMDDIPIEMRNDLK
jgi:hypothetical protein